ncbi:MAG: cysteine desulfurase family protein [Pseudomonadota bacterium]
MPHSVYLDYNATAPVKPQVIEVMAEVMADVGNPSSVHAQGRRARKRLSRAREQVAALVGAMPDAVIFTSGGTEANNQALITAPGQLLTSAIEHPSVQVLTDDQDTLPVNDDGVIDLDRLRDRVRSRSPDLLALMLANNETGVIQPVQQVAAIIDDTPGVKLHVDAIQAAGKIPIDMVDLAADSLSLSAHKIGGPQGVGALVLREGLEPRALLRGGAQERRFRAGTENLPGIVGFGEAAALALEDADYHERVRKLRDRLEREMLGLSSDVRVVGAKAPRLPNTSCLILRGVSHETQLIHFDLAGIAVSAGSACSSGKVGPSPVLTAMGHSLEDATSAIRVSLGWNSTDGDVDHFLNAAHNLLSRRKQRRHNNVASVR